MRRLPNGGENVFDREFARRAAQTPAQRKAEVAARNRMLAEERARKNLYEAARNFRPGKILNAAQRKQIDKLRQLSLSNNWREFFRLWPLSQQGHVKTPQYGIAHQVTKFRFNWGPDGKPRYVPFDEAAATAYFSHPQRGRWIKNVPASFQCDDNWVQDRIREAVEKGKAAARQFPVTDPRHALDFKASEVLCKRPDESLWVKIRKPLLIAAGAVAAVYLGPTVVKSIGSAASGSGTATGVAAGKGVGAAGGQAAAAAAKGATAAVKAGAVKGGVAVSKASFFSQVKNTANNVLDKVNRAREIEAVVKGEIPPPPISITGNTFQEAVFDIAKKETLKIAQEKALEAGAEYVQKKLTEKEEQKLREEIARMQRELEALIPKDVQNMPPEPDPRLATPLKNIQKVGEKRKQELEKLLIPAAVVLGILALG